MVNCIDPAKVNPEMGQQRRDALGAQAHLVVAAASAGKWQQPGLDRVLFFRALDALRRQTGARWPPNHSSSSVGPMIS
ncbi:MAG TPA: hypothetical protein VFC28_12180, partial [Opitutaceae bacterium]|nr:hypothetical protein [Opitutaceae bacterium]